MAPEPRGSTDTRDAPARTDSWTARPVLAWAIRFGIFAVPLMAGWLSVHYAVRIVHRPPSTVGTIVWIAGAIVLSTLVYVLCRRALARFSSLGVLYRLSLTFPDAAPSRLRATFRPGRVEELAGESASHTASRAFEPRMKAKRIADLVTMVSRLATRSRSSSPASRTATSTRCCSG